MKRTTSIIGIFLLLSMLAGCGGGASSTSSNNLTPDPAAPAAVTQEFLYVSDTNGQLFGFSIDTNSGALSQIRSGHEMDVVGGGFGGVVRVASDPNGNNLYVSRAALDGGANLMTLFLMPSPGELGTWSDLSQILTIPPGKLAVDPKSKNLYLIPDSSANLNEILSFAITPGTPHSPHLVPLPPPATAVSGVPQDITVDPSGHYVYVTFTGAAGVQVAGYSRDQTTGVLTNLPSSPFANTGGNNSQGIRVAPSGAFAVIANAASNNLSVMSLNSATGTLTNIAASPFPAGVSPLSAAIDPTSKFVFVANEGDNTLSAYAVGSAGGLTAMSGSPFAVGSKPQSVTADLSGKFVYVDTVDGNVWGFTLDTVAATLKPIAGSPFHPNLVNNPADLGLCVPCGWELRDISVLKP